MQRVLNTDPSRRYTIADIRRHPWYNQQPSIEREGIIVGVNPIPVGQCSLTPLRSTTNSSAS